LPVAPAAGWAAFTGAIVTNPAGTTNSVTLTLTPQGGNLFFRLGP
jgi:hypothetical protein